MDLSQVPYKYDDFIFKNYTFEEIISSTYDKPEK
jgi:hypothetical protein